MLTDPVSVPPSPRAPQPTDRIRYRGWVPAGDRAALDQHLTLGPGRLTVDGAQDGPLTVTGIARVALLKPPTAAKDSAPGFAWGVLVAYDGGGTPLLSLPVQPWGPDQWTSGRIKDLDNGRSLAGLIALDLEVPLDPASDGRAPAEPAPVVLREGAATMWSYILPFTAAGLLAVIGVLVFFLGGPHHAAARFLDVGVVLAALTTIWLLVVESRGRAALPAGDELLRPRPAGPAPRGFLEHCRITRRGDRIVVTDALGAVRQLPAPGSPGGVATVRPGGAHGHWSHLLLDNGHGHRMLTIPFDAWFGGAGPDAPREFAGRLGVPYQLDNPSPEFPPNMLEVPIAPGYAASTPVSRFLRNGGYSPLRGAAAPLVAAILWFALPVPGPLVVVGLACVAVLAGVSAARGLRGRRESAPVSPPAP